MPWGPRRASAAVAALAGTVPAFLLLGALPESLYAVTIPVAGLLWVAIWARAFWRIKLVLDNDGVYIRNYWFAERVPWSEVASISAAASSPGFMSQPTMFFAFHGKNRFGAQRGLCATRPRPMAARSSSASSCSRWSAATPTRTASRSTSRSAAAASGARARRPRPSSPRRASGFARSVRPTLAVTIAKGFIV